jgi:hypothetical protein
MAHRKTTEVAPADAATVIDLICAEIDKVAEFFTTEASWRRLEQFFYEQLVRETALSVAIVEWAKAGHPAAHRAISRYAREMGERSRFDQMLVSIRAYVLSTAEGQFLPYPRGRRVVANMMRDIWIPLVMQNVAEGTGLSPTRSASTTTPSVAFFLHRAFRKRGVKIGERELNRIFWGRGKLAAAIEASMPPIALTAAG